LGIALGGCCLRDTPDLGDEIDGAAGVREMPVRLGGPRASLSPCFGPLEGAFSV